MSAQTPHGDPLSEELGDDQNQQLSEYEKFKHNLVHGHRDQTPERKSFYWLYGPRFGLVKSYSQGVKVFDGYVDITHLVTFRKIIVKDKGDFAPVDENFQGTGVLGVVPSWYPEKREYYDAICYLIEKFTKAKIENCDEDESIRLAAISRYSREPLTADESVWDPEQWRSENAATIMNSMREWLKKDLGGVQYKTNDGMKVDYTPFLSVDTDYDKGILFNMENFEKLKDPGLDAKEKGPVEVLASSAAEGSGA